MQEIWKDIIGICKSTISMCLNGRYETAGGYVWKFDIKNKNVSEGGWESETNIRL